MARTFRVDRALLAARSSESAVTDAQASILDAVAGDLRTRHITGPAATGDVMVSRMFLHLGENRRRELRDRLSAIIQEYSDDPESQGDETEIALALFPVQHGQA